MALSVTTLTGTVTAINPAPVFAPPGALGPDAVPPKARVAVTIRLHGDVAPVPGAPNSDLVILRDEDDVPAYNSTLTIPVTFG